MNSLNLLDLESYIDKLIPDKMLILLDFFKYPFFVKYKIKSVQNYLDIEMNCIIEPDILKKISSGGVLFFSTSFFCEKI